MYRRLLTAGILFGLIAVLAGCGGLFPFDPPVDRTYEPVIRKWEQAIQHGSKAGLESVVSKEVDVIIGATSERMKRSEYAKFELQQWDGKVISRVEASPLSNKGETADSITLTGLFRVEYTEFPANVEMLYRANLVLELSKESGDWKIARIERTDEETEPRPQIDAAN